MWNLMCQLCSIWRIIVLSAGGIVSIILSLDAATFRKVTVVYVVTFYTFPVVENLLAILKIKQVKQTSVNSHYRLYIRD